MGWAVDLSSNILRGGGHTPSLRDYWAKVLSIAASYFAEIMTGKQILFLHLI